MTKKDLLKMSHEEVMIEAMKLMEKVNELETEIIKLETLLDHALSC